MSRICAMRWTFCAAWAPRSSALRLTSIRWTLGAEIVTTSLPEFPDGNLVEMAEKMARIICTAEAVWGHERTYPDQAESFGPWFREWLEIGATVTGADYAKVYKQWSDWSVRFEQMMNTIDILACVPMPEPAFEVDDEMQYGPMWDMSPTIFKFTAPFNFSGAPTLTLPFGFDSDGMPMSLQFVGRRYGEQRLLQLGRAFEEAVGTFAWPPIG